MTTTSLIPVIDLLGGQVVRGIGGQRQTYKPIVSALCRSSDPVVVGRILCSHCDSSRLYLADLDALMGGAVQTDCLRGLLAHLPDVQELWLDAGFADADAATAVLADLAPRVSMAATAAGPQAARVRPVFGSESLASRAALAACIQAHPGAVLSLDRRGAERLDPAGCWDAPELWPERVIVMTLERVGSGAGPDLQTLREVQARAAFARAPSAVRVFGAGGLRTPADLAAAVDAGAAGWLVASALHDLTLAPVAGLQTGVNP